MMIHIYLSNVIVTYNYQYTMIILIVFTYKIILFNFTFYKELFKVFFNYDFTQTLNT